MTLLTLPLHKHAYLIDACADVLNEEWPRSKTARLHSLNKSNDNLPYSIAFVEEENGAKSVIGYSRLCCIHNISRACFIESVIVRKSKRGQGYGRKVMNMTELEAQRLGFSIFYLTTHDKQDFYHHIGYEFCDAIISLGAASSMLSSDMRNKLLGRAAPDPAVLRSNKTRQDTRNSMITNTLQFPDGEMETCVSEINVCSDGHKDASACDVNYGGGLQTIGPATHPNGALGLGAPCVPPASPSSPPAPPPLPPCAPPLPPPLPSVSNRLAIQRPSIDTQPKTPVANKVFWMRKITNC